MSGIRGAIPFSAGGADYTLRFGLDAMDLYGETHGEAFIAATARLEGIEHDPRGPRLIGDLFWAGLTPRPERTRIAEIIDELGFVEAVGLLGRAIKAAFPDRPAETEGAEAP